MSLSVDFPCKLQHSKSGSLWSNKRCDCSLTPLIGMGSEEGRTFGKEPRELCGAIDLGNKFKLQKHFDLLCKSSVASSVTESNYLGDVVGDSKIRKEETSKLDRLLVSTHHMKDGRCDITPFDPRVLWGAFKLREAIDVVTKGKGNSEHKRNVKRKRKHGQDTMTRERGKEAPALFSH